MTDVNGDRMMEPSLETGAWYWIRRPDQSLAAYRFYKLSPRAGHGLFYVGSQLQTFLLSLVVGRADGDSESQT